MADLFLPLPSLDDSHEDRFFRVELGTGLMFSKIALEARHRNKRDRNCANARRAYDALLYFSPKMPNGLFVRSNHMTRGMAQLKAELQLLGEEL